MTDTPVLYGFNGSTYVRSVRMLLLEKEVAYDQVPLNVLELEPRSEEHRARHPFGKVPVLDIDGMRLLETDAILRYLDETRPGRSFTPPTPPGRARMTMAISAYNAYGFPALVVAAGYYLFPDFVGGKNDAAHAAALEKSERFLTLVMDQKGDDPWLAGDAISLADILLGPMIFYSALTPDWPQLSALPGVADWWERMAAYPAFQSTAPDLG